MDHLLVYLFFRFLTITKKSLTVNFGSHIHYPTCLGAPVNFRAIVIIANVICLLSVDISVHIWLNNLALMMIIFISLNTHNGSTERVVHFQRSMTQPRATLHTTRSLMGVL